MSDRAKKVGFLNRKVKKSMLFLQKSKYKIDRLIGDFGTPEADTSNQKAVEHQHIHDNKMENEQYEQSDSFLFFDEFDQARKNLVILERYGHVLFEELEVCRTIST